MASVYSAVSNCIYGAMKPIKVKVDKTPIKRNWWQRVKRTFSFIVTEEYKPPPVKNNLKTLVLDLDETLVHSSQFLPHPDVESFQINDEDGGHFYIHLRPGVKQFLEFATSHFDVFIFTYGVKSYADKILDVICPNVNEEHRFYRDSCELKEHGHYVHKDLEIFQRPEADVILVDDNFSAKMFHPDNTVQIQQWKGTPTDDNLVGWLIPILEECERAQDVRQVINSHKSVPSMKRRSAP